MIRLHPWSQYRCKCNGELTMLMACVFIQCPQSYCGIISSNKKRAVLKRKVLIWFCLRSPIVEIFTSDVCDVRVFCRASDWGSLIDQDLTSAARSREKNSWGVFSLEFRNISSGAPIRHSRASPWVSGLFERSTLDRNMLGKRVVHSSCLTLSSGSPSLLPWNADSITYFSNDQRRRAFALVRVYATDFFRAYSCQLLADWSTFSGLTGDSKISRCLPPMQHLYSDSVRTCKYSRIYVVASFSRSSIAALSRSSHRSYFWFSVKVIYCGYLCTRTVERRFSFPFFPCH